MVVKTAIKSKNVNPYGMIFCEVLQQFRELLGSFRKLIVAFYYQKMVSYVIGI